MDTKYIQDKRRIFNEKLRIITITSSFLHKETSFNLFKIPSSFIILNNGIEYHLQKVRCINIISE